MRNYVYLKIWKVSVMHHLNARVDKRVKSQTYNCRMTANFWACLAHASLMIQQLSKFQRHHAVPSQGP